MHHFAIILVLLELSNRLNTIISVVGRDLRSASVGALVVPRTRTELGKRAFAVAGPRAWNKLPLSVKSATTLQTFKSRLSEHLLQLAYGPT